MYTFARLHRDTDSCHRSQAGAVLECWIYVTTSCNILGLDAVPETCSSSIDPPYSRLGQRWTLHATGRQSCCISRLAAATPQLRAAQRRTSLAEPSMLVMLVLGLVSKLRPTGGVIQPGIATSDMPRTMSRHRTRKSAPGGGQVWPICSFLHARLRRSSFS